MGCGQENEAFFPNLFSAPSRRDIEHMVHASGGEKGRNKLRDTTMGNCLQKIWDGLMAETQKPNNIHFSQFACRVDLQDWDEHKGSAKEGRNRLWWVHKYRYRNLGLGDRSTFSWGVSLTSRQNVRI